MIRIAIVALLLLFIGEAHAQDVEPTSYTVKV